ncbi:MAG: hypothetical protein U5Q44_09915 [Dehalococcoidia bacterium]|nr:hypothetical protein [Dehalococcoidia bacterium]
MLGLGEEVARDVLGVGAVVGDDERLGWPVDGVDADVTEDLPLGNRGEQPAGTINLIDAGDGLGAVVRHGGDGLRGARLEDRIDAGDVRGDKLDRWHLAVRC